MDEAKTHYIRYVRLIIVDLNDMPSAMLITDYQPPTALKDGMGFDGSSMGLVNIGTAIQRLTQTPERSSAPYGKPHESE